MKRRRAALLIAPLLLVAIAPPAGAQRAWLRPTLHEVIPTDPREDVAFGVAIDGDLPAALSTPQGLVSVPDPARPVGSGEAPYSLRPPSSMPGDTFQPDRNTKRPDTMPYDDPFSPSTAPFKRLAAYDTVDAQYTVLVRDRRFTGLAVSPSPPPDVTEERFFADLVIDLAGATRRVRIPSVAPGARILHARAGVGTQDVKVSFYRDGAENWFIEGDAAARVRLVMEVAAPRAAFGGDYGNPTRAELATVPALPENVRKSAAVVAQKIGVTPRSPPREALTKLVAYFRAFQDSDDPPPDHGDIYLELALQQKGVCRHRAFAFLVTSLYLGLPTRLVTNEAHAWVEVQDGRAIWRRIDLGGAGRTLHDPLSANVPHEPPPDPFNWPQGASRGEDLADRMRRPPTSPSPPSSASPQSTASAAGSAGAPDPSIPGSSGGDPSGSSSGSSGGGAFGSSGSSGGSGGVSTALRPVTTSGAPDDRPASSLTMTLGAGDARRGAPMPVRGRVVADGEPCGHVAVEIVLRSRAQGDIPIGVVATDERGQYDAGVVLPTTLQLGDYEVHARTLGDNRCGKGQTR